MDKPIIVSKHVFLLLFIFWGTWMYTEITEYTARESFNAEVKEFMFEGKRNTSAMGYDLCIRIKWLEERHPEYVTYPIDCESIYGKKNDK